MIRKERLRDAAFSWDVLEKAPYAVLAMTDGDGQPYCIPVSPVADRKQGVIYMHCAKVGKKLDVLRQNPRACLTAVSQARSLPREFEMSFASAVFTGRIEEVEDRQAKMEALRLLSQHYDPTGMDRFASVAERLVDGTCVLKIIPEEITGKEAPDPEA